MSICARPNVQPKEGHWQVGSAVSIPSEDAFDFNVLRTLYEESKVKTNDLGSSLGACGKRKLVPSTPKRKDAREYLL